ncbi:MAG: RNA polymerase sigma factor RpoD/SigA [Treponema sp.]|nr:RNA polymerase sigma factor RpoD/SigA [Treponema sp.]MCL2250605.1 RNA polymerase sigma factor RpoD/SigA [Treponema sp.]
MNKEAKVRAAESNLSIYFTEINRIKILTREEEEQTARAAAAGCKAAREKLVNANLRFVVSVAKKYQGLGLPLEDLISEGNVGLLNAVDRFDVDKGYHFISYAVWWIRQAIMSALYEKARMIRLPVNRATELVKIEKARKIIKSDYSTEEEIAEIANLLTMEKEQVTELINISREILSLDNPVSDDGILFLKDSIEDDLYMAPDVYAERKLMESDIEGVLNTLDKDEAAIIRYHYGLGKRNPMSLKDIGMLYNLSKERIRQIEEKALARLRNPKRTKKLQAYVA